MDDTYTGNFRIIFFEKQFRELLFCKFKFFLEDCLLSCKYWVAGSTELFDGLQCIVSKKYVEPRKTTW